MLEEKPWHGMRIEEVAAGLRSDRERGLSPEEAEERRRRFGDNRLSPFKTHGPLMRFLLQFHQPLVLILLAAAAVTAALGEWLDSAVILAVVVVNAVIGFVQESKALRAIEALQRAMTATALVVRSGEKRRIPAEELVPGDVVLLQSGDKVPADLRLFECREFRVDESALTGESLPVTKTEEPVEAETVLGDRHSMAFSSTLVIHGAAKGLVVATGDRSEIGRINRLIATAEVMATPLTRKIERFSRLLLWVILGLSAVTFAAGTLHGHYWVDMFMAAVALAVSAIPEGLPAALTITLAIGVARMARRNAIIRKLPAVETLGGTTVICSDKTGTLTRNQMTVTALYAAGADYEVTGVGYAPRGEIRALDGAPPPPENRALAELLVAGVLCNDAHLLETAEGFRIEGDPTEGALLVAARKAGIDPELTGRDLPRIDAIPFESARQYMATLHDAGPGKPPVVYVKGSVESLCLDCGTRRGAGGGREIGDPAELHAAADRLAASGLRVLACARKEMPPGSVRIRHEDLQEGLEFLGLFGMIDPPRPEAARAVRQCQEAGIRVKMITGDHAGTAAAIARQLGLCGAACPLHDREVLTGKELARLSGAELDEAAEHTAVFARVSPEQKLRLVEALQRRRHVVAMTGDGVNDAPALKKADIGIAMGINGTEVSKEAADMILTDDNFATIEAAVEEGRGVFDNLTKFITWTLPTNGGESLALMVAVFLGLDLPVLPLQVLWINMTTAVLLGLTLAFEPKEPGIMQRPPRDADEPILGPALLSRIAIVSLLLMAGAFGLFKLAVLRGDEVELARTLAVNLIVFGETAYLFNCRSLTRPVRELGWFSNRWFWGGVLAMSALQVAFTCVPILNRIFGTRPMGLSDWLLVLGCSLVVSLVVGAEKALRRRSAARRR
ncbi:MAG: cation-transporting P-type ATPase [Desulfobacterales bacterium]